MDKLFFVSSVLKEESDFFFAFSSEKKRKRRRDKGTQKNKSDLYSACAITKAYHPLNG